VLSLATRLYVHGASLRFDMSIAVWPLGYDVLFCLKTWGVVYRESMPMFYRD
jgi:hypothetical protein